MQQMESLYGCCGVNGEGQREFTACKFVQKAYCDLLKGDWENCYFFHVN
jgi:hypothetical protein